jgi:rubrerythrin
MQLLSASTAAIGAELSSLVQVWSSSVKEYGPDFLRERRSFSSGVLTSDDRSSIVCRSTSARVPLLGKAHPPPAVDGRAARSAARRQLLTAADSAAPIVTHALAYIDTLDNLLADQAAREEELVLKLRAQATENQQVVAQLDALAVQARAAQQSEAKYREKLQQLAAESDRAIAAANAATSDAVQKGEQLAHDVDMQRKAMQQAESELAALREQLADVKAAGSLTAQQLALKEVKLHALEKVIQDGVEVWPCDLCGLGCEKSQLKLHWVGCRMSLAAEVRLSCAAQLCRSSAGMQT